MQHRSWNWKSDDVRGKSELCQSGFLPLTCTLKDKFLRTMKELAFETCKYTVHLNMPTSGCFHAIWSMPGTVINFAI